MDVIMCWSHYEKYSGSKTRQFTPSIGRGILPQSVDLDIAHAHTDHSRTEAEERRNESLLFCCALPVQVLCIVCVCYEVNTKSECVCVSTLNPLV